MRASEEQRREMTGEDQPRLEKNDMKAMILAGFLTLGLPCLLLILLILGVTMLLFGR